MKKHVLLALVLLLLLLMLMFMPAALAETTEATVPAIDLTALINAVIALLAALVTYRLVPWLKARTTSTQQELIAAAIRTAVYAAEQLYITDVISNRLDYAENWLREHGYTVSRAEIEAAVRQIDATVCRVLVEVPELIGAGAVSTGTLGAHPRGAGTPADLFRRDFSSL